MEDEKRDCTAVGPSRKIQRDVEGLTGMGIAVAVEGMLEGCPYQLSLNGFSPAVACSMDERPELGLPEAREDGLANYDLYYPALCAARAPAPVFRATHVQRAMD